MMPLVCAIVVLTIIINYQQKEKGIMNKIHQWVKLTIVSSIYISERRINLTLCTFEGNIVDKGKEKGILVDKRKRKGNQ